MASSPPESQWYSPPSPLTSMLFQPNSSSERSPEILPHLEALRDEFRQMEFLFEGNRDPFILFFIRSMVPPGRAAPLLLKLLLLECLLGACAISLADFCASADADGVVVQAISEATNIWGISNGKQGSSSGIVAHGSNTSGAPFSVEVQMQGAPSAAGSSKAMEMETQNRSKSRARVFFESLRSIDAALSALATLLNIVKFIGLVLSWLRGSPIPGPT